MSALVVKHGRPGFYFCVLEEGKSRLVSEINAFLYLHLRDRLVRALRILLSRKPLASGVFSGQTGWATGCPSACREFVALWRLNGRIDQ
jgi:hypothetical protein